MPRILIGIIRNSRASKTNNNFADTLPQMLKVLTLLWGTGEKLVVQRLLTLRQFKDRGFFWPLGVG